MNELYAEKFLYFYVAGTPRVVNGHGGLLLNSKTNDKRSVYIKNMNLALENAIKEQNWELTDEPIYISVKILAKADQTRPIEKLKARRGFYIANRSQRFGQLSAIVYVVEAIMYKKVYTNKRRVVGITITREYAEEDGMEVVVGTVGTVGDMMHDLKATQ